jgi:hypothetical protein
VEGGCNILFSRGSKHSRGVVSLWSGRNLNNLGKIGSIKTIALSKLVYSSSLLCVQSESVLTRGKESIFAFIWNFKPDKIRRSTLIDPVDKGGLNMASCFDVNKLLKTTWVKKKCFCDDPDNNWYTLLKSFW